MKNKQKSLKTKKVLKRESAKRHGEGTTHKSSSFIVICDKHGRKNEHTGFYELKISIKPKTNLRNAGCPMCKKENNRATA